MLHASDLVADYVPPSGDKSQWSRAFPHPPSTPFCLCTRSCRWVPEAMRIQLYQDLY